MQITKPNLTNLNEYFKNYINLVPQNDLLTALKVNLTETQLIFESISSHKENYSYAADKWSIKEVLSHIIEVERIFVYRALRFSRQDETELSGYNDDDYVLNSNAANRKLTDLIQEFIFLRKSTIAMFTSFNTGMLDFEGKANNYLFTARVLGFVIVGHTIHHSKILSERY